MITITVFFITVIIVWVVCSLMIKRTLLCAGATVAGTTLLILLGLVYHHSSMQGFKIFESLLVVVVLGAISSFPLWLSKRRLMLGYVLFVLSIFSIFGIYYHFSFSDVERIVEGSSIVEGNEIAIVESLSFFAICVMLGVFSLICILSTIMRAIAYIFKRYRVKSEKPN